MDDAMDTVAILDALQHTPPFKDLPLTKRPEDDLWMAMNETLLALRMAIYHIRLGKRAPKPKDRENAIQMALALLAAFGYVMKTRQAVVSSERGIARSISFQPRPASFNWTHQHALTCQMSDFTPASLKHYGVRIDDFMFLTVKTICAVAYYQMGYMRDGTSTFNFGGPANGIWSSVIVREHRSPRSKSAYLLT